MNLLLEYTLHKDDELRGAAVLLVARKLFAPRGEREKVMHAHTRQAEPMLNERGDMNTDYPTHTREPINVQMKFVYITDHPTHTHAR